MQKEFQILVERKLVLQDRSTGQKGEIRLAIGQPYWSDPGMEGSCPVALYGYHGRLADIRGIDPLSALALAIPFLESLLEGLPENLTVYWPSGEAYFDE
ncbi:hypothetical protein [Roseateles sp.]|uniref:hypothetical protein n=1 Tax=Roseateles sp. TaxID=1971397 RepID=UPI0032640396